MTKHTRPQTTHNTIEIIKSLPGIGFFEDDIHAHMQQAAKSNIQDIVDILAEQYRKKTGIRTLPSEVWKALWSKAHTICAQHCMQLAQELESEADKMP